MVLQLPFMVGNGVCDRGLMDGDGSALVDSIFWR